MNEFDIVVIGAGAAGIAAARAAREAKLTCQVIEANDRVGGRAFTDTASLSRPFDHGCQWLHSASINPLTAFADRFGMRYSKWNFSFRIHDGSWWLNDTLADDYMASMHAAYERMDQAGKAGRDVAAGTCLDPKDRWTELFSRNYTSYMSAPPSEVSVYDTSRYAQTDENWPVDDGYGALIARLAEGQEIRLMCRAKSVDWGGDQIMVGTPDGMLFARAVIVTVSTAVLAAGRVKFFPLLPDWKQAAIAQTPLGFA
jgi:monoamine oxidase